MRKKLANASVSRIQIERPAGNARVTIHTARPGIVIGKKGEDVRSLRQELIKNDGCACHISVSKRFASQNWMLMLVAEKCCSANWNDALCSVVQ